MFRSSMNLFLRQFFMTMKKSVFILFLLVSIVSCSDIVRIESELDNIESFLQNSPDSALGQLQRIDPASLSYKKFQARYALLYSMALDKNYIDINNDSLARVAVDYYSRHRDQYHAMLSWYSLGRVQMNASRHADAIISFIEAGNMADAIHDDHYQGLIYRNIGDLYSRQNDTEEALKHYSESVSSFEAIGEESYASYSLFPMAIAYNNLGLKAKSDSLFARLDQYCSKTEDIYLRNQISVARGVIALLENEDNAADAIRSIKTGINGRIRPEDAGYLMYAYACLRQADSSEYYGAIASQKAITPLDSARYYALLSRTQNRRGDYQSALHYQNMAVDIQNRLMNKRESMFISNSLAQYHQTKADKAKAVTVRTRILFVTTALFLLLLLLFLLQRLKIRSMQNREKDRKIAEMEARIQEDLARADEILKEIQGLKNEKDQILSTLSSSVLEQMTMVNKWSEAYYGISKEDKNWHRHLDTDYIEKKEDIIRHFCESLEAVRKDDKWFSQIEESVNLYKDGIMEKVRGACYQPDQKKQQMDESDFRTLLLMFAGLPDKTIAFFLGLSYGAVRMRRLRYREYFNRLPVVDASVFLDALS